jgi:hypothetical protein
MKQEDSKAHVIPAGITKSSKLPATDKAGKLLPGIVAVTA